MRVRIVDGRDARLTIKSAEAGTSREEFEYDIPVEGARSLMALCEGRIIAKTRHVGPFEGHNWEVDCFGGALEGLVIAELELADADQDFARPGWLGDEVTGDERYYNARLADSGSTPARR